MAVVRQSRAPWLLGGAWQRTRFTWPPGWRYGFITAQRSLKSRAYYPGALERMALPSFYNAQPYWHVINYTLASRVSADGEILPEQNFIALYLMATTDQANPSFRSQFFQVVDADRGNRMSRLPLNNANLFGTAQRPLILKRPYPMPNGRTLLNRTGNLTTVQNVVQLVVFGMKENPENPLTAESE